MPSPNSLGDLRRILAAAPPRLLSIDLFDTLLLRGTRPEFIRFVDVAKFQHQILDALSPGPARLLEARLRHTRNAYAVARATPGGGEVRFDAILAEICHQFTLPTTWIERLRQTELDYEIRHLRTNRALMRLIRRWSDDGMAWAVVSDTPLRGDDLSWLMTKLLPELSPPLILSSADVGQTKRDGGLFDHLIRQSGLEPSDILHLGDNPHSDLHMAQVHGLRAAWLPRPRWWRLIHGFRARHSREKLRRAGLIP
ncbi:MAG: hypothetical protein AB7G62_08365 [Magnetospirillum sp.]